MGERRHRLPADHLDYGTICPTCASPKARQSMRCADCYYELRRAHLYPDPPDRTGCRPHNYIDGERGHRATGRTSARPQPADHPWRKADSARVAQIRSAAA